MYDTPKNLHYILWDKPDNKASAGNKRKHSPDLAANPAGLSLIHCPKMR